MAGKLIKRKLFYEWLRSFALDREMQTDDRHIDSFIFSTVNRTDWENILWELYKIGKRYLRKMNKDIGVGIYACIKFNKKDLTMPLEDITDFKFAYDIMPPCILLWRGDKHHVFNNIVESKSISRKYKMKAFLYHWDDDPKYIYYLTLL